MIGHVNKVWTLNTSQRRATHNHLSFLFLIADRGLIKTLELDSDDFYGRKT